ncbi:MAG: release factor glutamine methyltransferase [Chloroflexota bacterium]|jgi:release factor glutamine methyltransferase|nr:release factor glutamine methyltransferase [Chloroflexota bacterium]
MLATELAATVRRRGRARVVDVGTGSGVLATVAALAGAEATAVDGSRRALLSARATAQANGVRMRTLRGDLLGPVWGERFDVVVSNPPYVPAETDDLPSRGLRRATDAGVDGRAIIDRLCREAPGVLAPGGELLLVHSGICDEARTLEQLRRAGLSAEIVRRHRGGFGPLVRARRELLVERGVLDPAATAEDVVILRGRQAVAA